MGYPVDSISIAPIFSSDEGDFDEPEDGGRIGG